MLDEREYRLEVDRAMGQRIRNIYPYIYAFENLLFAERDAARGKRGRLERASE